MRYLIVCDNDMQFTANSRAALMLLLTGLEAQSKQPEKYTVYELGKSGYIQIAQGEMWIVNNYPKWVDGFVLKSYTCDCGFIVAINETECMNCNKQRE